MAADSARGRPPRAGHEPNHGAADLPDLAVVAVVADLLIWFVWGPHLPPGTMSSAAQTSSSTSR